MANRKNAGIIPMGEAFGAALMAANKFPGLSGSFESSVIKHRLPLQRFDGFEALIASDFSASQAEATQLSAKLTTIHDVREWRQYIADNPPSADAIAFLIVRRESEAVTGEQKKVKAGVSKMKKNAADALHSQPGGSREKQEAIRAAWASGKFSSRTVCAEQECAEMNMSYDSARRALRNTPKPA